MAKIKPTVMIIGPGRLGTALAIALSRVGYPIQSLVGRKPTRLRRVVALLEGEVRALTLKKIRQPEDVVLITTPDDQLSTIADALSRLKFDSPHLPIVLHTSGALSSQVLSPLAEKGWRVGSIHPLVSVSDPVNGAKLLLGAFWCVEGNRLAVKQARLMVGDLGGHCFSIKSTAKPLYHAAAVMTSGNLVALFDTAIDMLRHCGLQRKEAQKILTPLLQSTLDNLRDSVPAKALTGTFSRGDVTTVERHLKAMTGDEMHDARELYRLLGRKALSLAEANGLDGSVSRRMAKLLQ
ncbi:MAG TPA: Rossmann-like and DUF2520 domain-containing protein [Pyrinomonadaceae bacterium]|nr:Rossmann-like and DUF2520 domain-containing protein [Pyrinomonadaceae bacterium]